MLRKKNSGLEAYPKASEGSSESARMPHHSATMWASKIHGFFMQMFICGANVLPFPSNQPETFKTPRPSSSQGVK